jgi:hypothetical protein
LEVSLRLFGDQDELLLEIVRNECVAGDPLPWDIEADWQNLRLRERARHISVSLDAKVVPIEVRGEFIRLGRRVSVNNHGIRFDGNNAWGFRELALIGPVLEAEPSSEGWRLKGGSLGNPDAGLVSWPDKRERLRMAKEACRRMVSSHGCRRKMEMSPGAQSRNDTPGRRTGSAPHGITANRWARATGSRAEAGTCRCAKRSP